MRHLLKLCLLPVLLGAGLSRCASTVPLTLEEPRPGQSLLVGAVLLENDGIEEVYEAKTANIVVVLVGKSTRDGKETTESYRVKTDEAGYFMLPNVPPGAYVLKGIEVDLGYETRLFLTSRWEGNQQIYYPGEGRIDHTVRIWPEEVNTRVIDLRICYFRIDAALRTLHKRFPRLQNTALTLRDKTYTMENPQEYFRAKYPGSAWFNAAPQGETP